MFRRELSLLLFMLSLHTVVSTSCELTHADTILSCLSLSDFPIGRYYKVRTINFHNNYLNELTTSVFINHKFYSLQTAIIRHSNINIIHSHAFAKMYHLLELDLYGNNLTTLQKNIFADLESLEHLGLGQNEIVTMDAAILKPLRSLKLLDLSFNRIRNLAPQLIKHTNISELELSGNPIQFTKEDAILESSSLTTLSLQSCNIKELPSSTFYKLPKLMFLDLSKNGIKLLPENLLKHLLNLEHLDLSYNPIQYLSISMFPLPSKMEALLCYETPLEQDRKCDKIVDSLGNRNTNFYESQDENATEQTILNNFENGINLNSTNQVEYSLEGDMFQDVRIVSLVSFIGILILIIFGLVLYASWQKLSMRNNEKDYISV